MVHPRVEIGPYSVGEIPQPLQITFVDFDGNPLDLTNFAVDFVIESIGGTTPTDVGSGAATKPDAGAGVTQYAFIAADCLTAGRWRGQMWADNGTVRLASVEYWWDVNDVTTAPDFP